MNIVFINQKSSYQSEQTSQILYLYKLKCKCKIIEVQCVGDYQGKGGKSPPKPKKLLSKNGVISEDSIFSNKFSKIKIKQLKNQFFYRIFIRNFQNFLKISQQFVFPPNARKINAWFVIFLKNMPK